MTSVCQGEIILLFYLDNPRIFLDLQKNVAAPGNSPIKRKLTQKQNN